MAAVLGVTIGEVASFCRASLFDDIERHECSPNAYGEDSQIVQRGFDLHRRARDVKLPLTG